MHETSSQRMGFLVDNKIPSKTKNQNINFSTHLSVVGATGLGKTRKILDVHDSRFSKGQGMLWFDPKNVVFREILKRAPDKSQLYRLGIPGDGKNDVKINIFSLLTESEQKMYKFCFSLMVREKSGGSHQFWAESAAKMLFTSVMLFSTMNKFLIYVNEISNTDGYFENIITYYTNDEPKVKKEISFHIPSRPMTFKEFYEMISDREKFRQIVGNIFTVFDLFEEEMKGRVESGFLLTEKNASVLDTFLEDMARFTKEFSTYKLSADDGSASGTSGVWFTMCSSIPSTLFTDKSLNVPHSTHNTKELLESGKCIIVSINNEEVMGTLFNYYAEYFSTRASRPDIRPVTIMLEEANRLLTTMINIDLEKTITYSRQAKLSIVTVFQSWGQAYEVFGRYVAESIFENVTRLTMIGSGNKDTKYLYYSMDDNSIHSFDPKFATDKELYAAELEYQRITQQFASIEKSILEVVVFDHFLYEYSNEVTLVDVETLSSRSVKYMPIEAKKKNGYFVTKLKNRMRESSIENELSF